MNTEELMQKDWVKINGTPIYCKVQAFTEDGKVLGKTAGGGAFIKEASQLSPIELVQDTILCTSFWLKSRYIFKKTVRGVANFTYDAKCRLLTVVNYETNSTNLHRVAFLHELQHLYLHYVGNPLEVDMAHSKRKEYSKRYYGKNGVP